MGKKFRPVLILFLAVSMIFFGKLNVWAADTEQTGSISITLQEQTEPHAPVPGASFMIRPAAFEVEKDGKLIYEPSEEFKESGMDLSDLNQEGLAEHLAAFAAENRIPGMTETAGNDGKVIFKDLIPGVYLVVQTKETEGYYPASPFLVLIPMTSTDGRELLYDVDASPKVEAKPPKPEMKQIIVRKEWAGTGKHPDSVQIQLFCDGKVHETVVLDKKNNWQYRWKELDGAHRWTVVESQVPAGFTAQYKVKGNETIITNTGKSGTGPSRPGNTNLIQTGQLKWPVPVLAFAGVLLFALGWVLVYMKGSHDDKA